ncbi:MAG: hypothetical protein AAGC55_04235 [Myxococcota bacterium]
MRDDLREYEKLVCVETLPECRARLRVVRAEKSEHEEILSSCSWHE